MLKILEKFQLRDILQKNLSSVPQTLQGSWALCAASEIEAEASQVQIYYTNVRCH